MLTHNILYAASVICHGHKTTSTYQQDVAATSKFTI